MRKCLKLSKQTTGGCEAEKSAYGCVVKTEEWRLLTGLLLNIIEIIINWGLMISQRSWWDVARNYDSKDQGVEP